MRFVGWEAAEIKFGLFTLYKRQTKAVENVLTEVTSLKKQDEEERLWKVCHRNVNDKLYPNEDMNKTSIKLVSIFYPKHLPYC